MTRIKEESRRVVLPFASRSSLLSSLQRYYNEIDNKYQFTLFASRDARFRVDNNDDGGQQRFFAVEAMMKLPTWIRVKLVIHKQQRKHAIVAKRSDWHFRREQIGLRR